MVWSGIRILHSWSNLTLIFTLWPVIFLCRWPVGRSITPEAVRSGEWNFSNGLCHVHGFPRALYELTRRHSSHVIKWYCLSVNDFANISFAVAIIGCAVDTVGFAVANVAFAVVQLVLPWSNWFCRDQYWFCCDRIEFAAIKLILPWRKWFCRDLPWQLWATEESKICSHPPH